MQFVLISVASIGVPHVFTCNSNLNELQIFFCYLSISLFAFGSYFIQISSSSILVTGGLIMQALEITGCLQISHLLNCPVHHCIVCAQRKQCGSLQIFSLLILQNLSSSYILLVIKFRQLFSQERIIYSLDFSSQLRIQIMYLINQYLYRVNLLT